MDSGSFFTDALVYLTAAVVAVPVAKRLGLGSVLGYLIAGATIGPSALHLVGDDTQDVMHFAEFGVVMMLFLVGLELKPRLLWRLRAGIFGLGSAQVFLTAALVATATYFLVDTWQIAVAVGFTLALSSTAIALQTLDEKGLTKTRGGQSAFSILLFQDIAVIPLLALFPLLATLTVEPSGGAHTAHTWTENLAPWAASLVTVAAVATVVLAGRFLASHALRLIASTGLREIFTAAALLLVVAITVLMTRVGLSPALGTFLAGVVLSENEYRHELESDIAPFKGLLLGLFFIAVGSSIDFAYIAENLSLIAALVAALTVIKAAVLIAVGRLRKLSCDQALLLTVALAQGGEFAFVLTSFATGNGIFDESVAKPLIATVALSMALSPLLFLFNEKVLTPRTGTRPNDEKPADDMDESAPVIVAGFGRFGNVVGRFLNANGVETTVLEHDSDHIDLLRKIGIRAFYGDATRPDLLHAAGASHARLLIIALDDEDETLELVHTCRRHFPHLQLLVRACSRNHAYRLVNAGVEHFVLEQQASALDLGIEALHRIGHRRYAATRAARNFKTHDIDSVHELAKVHEDEKAYIDSARRRLEDLEARFKADRENTASQSDKAWDDTSLREKF